MPPSDYWDDPQRLNQFDLSMRGAQRHGFGSHHFTLVENHAADGDRHHRNSIAQLAG
jgi:hypothetical protein